MLRKRTLIAVIVVIMMAGAAIAIASRSTVTREPRLNTNSFDGRVVVGSVLDLRDSAGRETRRGLGLWKDKVDVTRGIAFGSNQVAPVKLIVRDSGGSARRAARQSRQLIREGASVLIGPPDATQLEAIAQVALDTRTMLISTIPRPTSVPRNRLLTFLARSEIGAFNSIFDALDAIRRDDDRRIRVAVVARTGNWARRGRAAHLLARSRGYASTIDRVDRTDPAPALRRARRLRPDLIVVLARFEDSVRWFRIAGTQDDPPWAVAVGDVSSAQSQIEAGALAVTAPWSPTTERGGPVFGPREFRAVYRDQYGDLATTEAAAAAAAGIVITQAVQTARSTDVSRMLRARDSLRTESLWGTLRFEDGEQVALPPAAVLLTPNGPQSIGPAPSQPALLVRSKPKPVSPAQPTDSVAPDVQP